MHINYHHDMVVNHESVVLRIGAFQSGNYGPPDDFCFDTFCDDLPIQDDKNIEVKCLRPHVIARHDQSDVNRCASNCND
jgi:hypothetical protein